MYDPTVGRFISRDTYEGSPTEPLEYHRYAYCANDPVNRIDPSGMFFIMDMALAGSMREMMSSAYSGVFAGAMRAAQSVAMGITAQQAVVGMLLDEILAPVDMAMETSEMIWGLMNRGVSFALEGSGYVTPDNGLAGVGLGTGVFSIYREIRYPTSIYQPNHLNQWAAFEDDYRRAGFRREDGITLKLEGSTQKVGSEHYRFHQHLRENLWSRYRGTDKRPTVDEYNRVMHEAISLIRGKATADYAVRFAQIEQIRLGLSGRSFLKKIPRS